MFYQTGISGPHYHAGELGQMREEKRAPLTPMNDTLARATGDRTPWIGIERVYPARCSFDARTFRVDTDSGKSRKVRDGVG
jgi:hypothetical protein